MLAPKTKQHRQMQNSASALNTQQRSSVMHTCGAANVVQPVEEAIGRLSRHCTNCCALCLLRVSRDERCRIDTISLPRCLRGTCRF